jgi:hypothetical protein
MPPITVRAARRGAIIVMSPTMRFGAAPGRSLLSSGPVTVKFSSPAKAGVTLSNHKTGVISMGRWSKAA